MAKYFYRIQRKDTKIGPYNSGLIVVDKYIYGSICCYFEIEGLIEVFGDRQPSPNESGLGNHIVSDPKVNFPSRFGFKSLTSLKKWFSSSKRIGEIFELHNFEIARYTVEERFDSKFQSVAYLDSMKNETIIPFSKVFVD